MRRLAPQVARWYSPRLPQARVPAFLLNQQQSRSIRKPRAAKPTHVEPLARGSKLRLFAEDPEDSDGDAYELDPKEEDFGEVNRLYTELKKLDAEIEELEDEDPFAPDSGFMRSLPEAERQELLEGLKKFDEEETAKTGAAIQDNAEESEIPENAVDEDVEKVTLQVPPKYQVIVNKFNDALEESCDEEREPTAADDLWIWYTRCKNAVPFFLHSIPQATWNRIWDSQDDIFPWSTRTAHYKILSQDIRSTGGSLSLQQMLSYIHGLDITGESDTAIDLWKTCKIDPGEQDQMVTEYLSLGLRLYSFQGNLPEAKSLATRLFRRQGISDYRSVKPMILAQAQIEGENGAKQAWTTYLLLKQGLQKNMTMEDYDDISIGFLQAGRADLAVAVFKDMMVSQERSQDCSEALYRQVLGQIGRMQSSAVKESDVNELSLAALTMIPRKFQNKFFYGSWLKKLIGMQQLDAASMVVDLMFERGLRPDARYLNGLISAWIQIGSPSEKAKAEALGWAMIRARIDFVSKRSSRTFQPKLAEPSSIDEVVGFSAPPPQFIRRDVPLATVETFAILTQYYARRSKDKAVQHLQYCLRLADLRPNTFIMNHLLYAELRKHDLAAVTRVYREMSPPIRPDLETFACFWDCSKLSLNRHKEDVVPTDFPTPRSLFRGMLNWFTGLPTVLRDDSRAQFSRELYDQIILCFCLSRDLQGTALALHSLQSLFGVYPDEKTATIVIHRIARLLPVDYSKLPVASKSVRRRLRRASGNPAWKSNVAKVRDVVETLYHRRAADLTDIYDDDQQGERRLGALTDLIMTTLWKVMAARDKPVGLRERIEDAANEMGCETEWMEEYIEAAKNMVRDGVV